MSNLLLFLGTICAIFTTAFSTCNVEDAGTTENIFNLNSFDGENADLVNVIFRARQINDTDGSYIRLVETDEFGGGGVSSSFWFKERQRLGDGFVATFKFRMQGTGLLSDGFAFLAQNDRINNIHGGIGSNLGFKGGLEKYIAVGFDFCNDRNPIITCNQSAVIVSTQAAQGTAQDLGSQSIDPNFVGGAEFKQARVVYAVNTAQIRVYIEDMVTPVYVQENVPNLRDLWGGEFAYFGFTASNLNDAPANIDIKDFRIDQLKSGARIVAGLNREYDFGTRVTLSLIVVDSCNIPLPLEESRSIIASAKNITATLSADRNPIVLDGNIVDSNSATYLIQFDLPSTVLDSWTLEVKYNGDIFVQDNPVVAAIVSVRPVINGLSQQTIIILCSVIALLALAVAYWLRRLYRYKKKLDENKDNIEAGEVLEKITEIEKDVTYKLNPLLGTLEEMQARLEKNKKILASFENGEGMDSNYTIEQLEEQNEQLKEEMNKLKQQEQEKEMFKGGGFKFQRKKKNITDFGQEEV